MLCTVSSSITCISLKRIGFNPTDEYVNAVCVTRTFRLLALAVSEFCGQCKDVRLDDGSEFLWSEPIFITRFSITRVSQNLLRIVSFEADPNPSTICATKPWTVEGFSFLWTRNVIVFLVFYSTRLCNAIQGDHFPQASCTARMTAFTFCTRDCVRPVLNRLC